MRLIIFGLLTLLCASARTSAQTPDLSFVADLVYAAEGSEELEKAENSYAALWPTGSSLSAESFAALETTLRTSGRGRRVGAGETAFDVSIPGDQVMKLRVTLPAKLKPGVSLPVVLAFGGGPIPRGRRGDQAIEAQAELMSRVWRSATVEAGWMLVSAIDSISRSSPGIRYEIVRPSHLEALLRAIRSRFEVNDDRVMMTGISLGSNYALACGSAAPELFCGAAPMACEGEGRPELLRNLLGFPTYMILGSLDRNIRDIAGPRAWNQILDHWNYDHVYEERPRGGHESFADRYPEILAWFADRPRRFWNKHILRVPHAGIMAPRRQRYWMSGDTRQGVFEARVDGNRINVNCARVGKIGIWLSDRLCDLDQEIIVEVNGTRLFKGRCPRDPRLAINWCRRQFDRRVNPAAYLELEIPFALASNPRSEAWAASMLADPRKKPGPVPLAFWEHYAWRHLRESRPELGLEGRVIKLASGRRGLKITGVAEDSPAARSGVKTGWTLKAFDGNPFFPGDDISSLLQLWCRRTEFAGNGPDLSFDEGRSVTTKLE